jgi:hypothetical protein
VELAAEAILIRPDWTASATARQPTSFFGSTDANANGFDFGISQPKTGLGYGLLGDARSPQQSQTCTDCPPSGPCPNCSDDSDADAQGQIIKVQAPALMPMPGMAPPPIGLLPQQPPGHVVIGDPNAWWNWTPYEIEGWINGSAHARPSQDVEEMCWEQYEIDTINCNIKKAYAGAAAARACHEQATARYADCRRQSKKSDIPAFDRR